MLFLYLYSNNDGDNPFSAKRKSVNETNQTSTPHSNQPGIRVTTNPNPNFQIPSGGADPSLCTVNKSSFTLRANEPINNSAFRYRPNTLNTTSDKNLQQATKATNVPSRKPTASNKNEPVYATVGSVNSNQRLVKNLKSANV